MFFSSGVKKALKYHTPIETYKNVGLNVKEYFVYVFRKLIEGEKDYEKLLTRSSHNRFYQIKVKTKKINGFSVPFYQGVGSNLALTLNPNNGYTSIRKEIIAQEQSFYFFIKTFILDDESWKILNALSKYDHVYVLSRIIRDFLSGDYEGARDFDCVLLDGNVRNKKIIHFLRESKVYVNSFGGVKIKRHKESIDVWKMADTWGIRKLGLDTSPESLIKTVFFNFSAIVYDFNNRKFIFDDSFCLFLKSHIMDIVYPDNPNILLCLVNILYYHKRYGYKISKKWQDG